MLSKKSKNLVTLLTAAVAILWITTAVWSYQIGHVNMLFKDIERGRTIPAEIYYPADSSGDNVPVAPGQFPLLVFGHGQQAPIPYQHHYWEHLVPEGYIMALPATQSGASICIDDFGEDLSFLLGALLDRTSMKDTLFAWHLDGTSAFMGYSMGGGASFLAQAGESKANTIVAIAPVGTIANYGTSIYGTNPIAVTKEVTVPVLIMAGELDCVCPVQTHQEPLYTGLSSTIKALVDVKKGNHCDFMDVTLAYGCPPFEAGFCPGQLETPISNEMQLNITLGYVRMWLDSILKGNGNTWAGFSKSLSEDMQVTNSFQGADEWPPEYLPAPRLTQEVEGTTGALFWNPVPGAVSYTLFYALYPYTGSIGSVDMGNMTRVQGDLWSGAAFYFAVKAINDSAKSRFSNIELMRIP